MHLCIKGRSDEALDALQSLQLAYLRVASLIYAPDGDAVRGKYIFKELYDAQLHAIRSECTGLYNQYILELVYYYTGQEVRLAKYYTAGGCVHAGLAQLPRIAKAAHEKCVIDHRVAPACHHAHGDLRVCIDEALPHRIAVKVSDLDDIAIFKAAEDAFYLIVIYPLTA